VLAEGTRVGGSADDAPEVGNLVHAALAQHVEGHEFVIAEAAARAELDPAEEEEALELYQAGERVWAERREAFVEPATERFASFPIRADDGSEWVIDGTMDVVSPTGANAAVFNDWKTGRLDTGHRHQGHGYAWLIWNVLGRPAEVRITGMFSYLRYRYVRTVVYDAPALEAWEHNLVHNVLPGRATFHPGSQCRWCGLRHTCPAKQAVMQGIVAEMILPANLGGAADPTYQSYLERASQQAQGLTRENRDAPELGRLVADLLFRLRLMRVLADDTEALVRGWVATVGHIGLPGGTALALLPQERRSIVVEKALPILKRRLKQEQIEACSTLSLTKVKKFVAAKVQRGEKGKIADAFVQELEAAGGIEVKPYDRLEEVPADQVPEDAALPQDPQPPTTDLFG
jgi:hypothetical protein